jgi:hypothetical protein
LTALDILIRNSREMRTESTPPSASSDSSQPAFHRRILRKTIESSDWARPR